MKRSVIIGSSLALIVGAGWLVLDSGFRNEGENSSTESASSNPLPDPKFDNLFNPSVNLPSRLALARSLDKTFQLESIRPHLLGIKPHLVPTNVEEHDFVIFNEIVSVHRLKALSYHDLAIFLQEIFQNSEMHHVLRDYAAQHLVTLAEANPESSPEILATLCQGLEDQSLQRTAIPGTLFNALNHLRRKAPELLAPFEQRLSASLKDLFRAPHLTTPAKVSLVQALKGQSQSPAARAAACQILRALIEDPTTHEAVLISAASVMGSIGSEDEIALLESLARRGTLATKAAQKSIQALKP